MSVVLQLNRTKVNMKTKYRILVIEDERKVASFIEQGLKENDFEVEVAYDGVQGKLLALTQPFDLLIIDLNLPSISGIQICQEVRKKYPDLPVIILTALGAIEDKMEAFSAGADDYVVKPFDFRELLARVKVFLKRSSDKSEASMLQVADLEINLDEKVVTRAGNTIELTPREFNLLAFLMRNKGKVVSRVDIAEAVWDINFDTGTNIIDVYVNFLRKKVDRDFEQKLILTKPGMGYILKED